MHAKSSFAGEEVFPPVRIVQDDFLLRTAERSGVRMSEILMKVAALCMLAALSEQLTGGRLRDGVRLICGLLAARLILETIYALPGALFS